MFSALSSLERNPQLEVTDRCLQPRKRRWKRARLVPVSRVLLCVSVLMGVAALAQNRPIAPTDCDDSFAECKEDCAIKWGGTTNLKSRARLNPCINKCGSIERDCAAAA